MIWGCHILQHSNAEQSCKCVAVTCCSWHFLPFYLLTRNYFQNDLIFFIILVDTIFMSLWKHISLWFLYHYMWQFYFILMTLHWISGHCSWNVFRNLPKACAAWPSIVLLELCFPFCNRGGYYKARTTGQMKVRNRLIITGILIYAFTFPFLDWFCTFVPLL